MIAHVLFNLVNLLRTKIKSEACQAFNIFLATS